MGDAGCGGDGGWGMGPPAGGTPGAAGGDGGRGGDANVNGTGGCGGAGGDGWVDGGDGGPGGDGKGNGCGGNGGDGGDGDAAHPTATGGDGGNGGNGPCAGSGGDGGKGNGDDGKDGSHGKPIRYVSHLDSIVEFANPYVLAQIALRDQGDVNLIAAEFDPIDGREIAWVATSEDPYDAEGNLDMLGILHPESLASQRITVAFEYEVTGPAPLIELSFAGTKATSASAVPHWEDQGWFVLQVTVVRQPGQVFGPLVDEFHLFARDIRTRLFYFADAGWRGDLNFDDAVTPADFQIVADNLGRTGDLGFADGDENQDGVVDLVDAIEVLSRIED